VVIVNFKVYPEALGPEAIKLSKVCEKVAAETGASIALVPALTDLMMIVKEVKLPVLAQHFDIINAGSHTGWVPIEAVKKTGAIGSLLNHSERKLPDDDLKIAIEKCRNSGIESVVCADTIEEVKNVAKFLPDYIAIEPPELIGGNISVTTAKPEIVIQAVTSIHAIESKIQVICGAGVKSGKDVRKALELGTVGVLIASGVVKASDPQITLRDLVNGLG